MTTVKAVLEVAIEFDTDSSAVSERIIIGELRRTISKANTGMKLGEASAIRWYAERAHE